MEEMSYRIMGAGRRGELEEGNWRGRRGVLVVLSAITDATLAPE